MCLVTKETLIVFFPLTHYMSHFFSQFVTLIQYSNSPWFIHFTKKPNLDVFLLTIEALVIVYRLKWTLSMLVVVLSTYPHNTYSITIQLIWVITISPLKSLTYYRAHEGGVSKLIWDYQLGFDTICNGSKKNVSHICDNSKRTSLVIIKVSCNYL